MKQIFKKLGSVFLTLCLVLTMLPTVAFAEDTPVDTLVNVINDYTGGTGTGLSATVDGDIVTVTGTVTDASSDLTLTIPSGVTVVWEASLTKTTELSGYLLNVQGEGAFKVVEGSTISAKGATIYNACTGGMTVSGGTVSSIDNIAIGNSGGVKLSGGTVSSVSGGAISNDFSGVVRISGDAIVENNSSNQPTIVQGNASTGTVDRIIIEGGTVKNDGTYSVILNRSTGGVMVSGGTVLSNDGAAIYNLSTGNVTVSGGEISRINNISTGNVTVSGGTVSSIAGTAITNQSTGVVRISGDATVQNNAASYATIMQSNSGTDTAERIIIEGGTVKNDGTGTAIFNQSTGETTVSGGTVSSNAGTAIGNIFTGVVRISGDAIVQNSSNTKPTISQNNSGTNTADRIVIEGGTVRNDGNNDAIINQSTGGVTVSGGTVTSSNGNAIHSISSGNVMVSGGTVSSNSYTILNGSGSVTVSGGTVSSTNNNAICNVNTGSVAVSGGTVLSLGTDKAAIYNDSTGEITISGGIVLAPGLALSDIIEGGSSSFPESSITGTGVAIAVAPDAFSTEQSSGTATNLSLWNAGGEETPVTSAQWAKNDDSCGVLVTSIEPDAFVPLDGVTVVLTPKGTDFTAPASLVYDGAPKAYTKPSDMNATIYYESTDTTTYIKSSIAPTDAGTYKVTADVVKNDDYDAVTDLEIGTMTINGKALTESMIGEIAVQNYTGGQISPVVTVTDGTELTKDTDYTVSYGGACTVAGGGTVTVTGMGNYTGSATKNFTVSSVELTITNGTIESKTYDGTTTATVTSVTLSGDVDSMALGTDFTAAGTFDDANVGSGRSVTIIVTLGNTDKAENYTVSGNYTLTGQTIAKGTPPTVSDHVIYHRHTVTGQKTVSIAGLAPTDVGTAAFAEGTETDSSNIINNWSVDANGMVTYTLNGGAAGNTATMPITVSTPYYQDFTINVVISLTDKDVTLVSIDDISVVYGESLAIQGTATFDNNPVAGAWSFVTDTSTLVMGSNSVTVKFTPTDDENYAEVTDTITVTISKATPTGAPNYTAITTTEKTLADGGLTTVDGTFSVTGTVDWVLINTTSVQKNTAYAWLFTPTDSTHYNTLSGSITLYPYSSGGTSSGGGSSSGGSSDIAEPSSTVSGSTATTTVTAKTGTDGKAAALVTQSQVNSAIKSAQKAAKNNGEAPKVEIQISGASNARATEATLQKAAIQALVTGEMEALMISSPVADMTFDAHAIAAIAGATSGDVSFTASNVENSTLSDTARQVVGDRPVYDFSVTSGSKTISQFNGTVTLSLPYTPAKGEDVSGIVAYYINKDGKPELIKNCYYDTKAGALIFTTDHFSQYAVGYNKVAFSDVSDTAWYADAISYLAAREITSGTTETTFGPGATLTRGQFITLLLRAYGIDADENPTDNFADAGNTYYTGYLATVKRLEISSGVGDNKFVPKQAITRQEMFTLLYNALKAIDQLPNADSGKTLSDFTDSGNVSFYAQEALTYLVKTGTVGGNNGQLNPTDTTTRSQMAQVLYNLISK